MLSKNDATRRPGTETHDTYTYTHTMRVREMRVEQGRCRGGARAIHIYMRCIYKMLVHPIAFGVSFNLNFQSQSPWSFFNGTNMMVKQT